MKKSRSGNKLTKSSKGQPPRSAKAEEAAKAREEARRKMMEDRRKLMKAKKENEWGNLLILPLCNRLLAATTKISKQIY